MPEKLPDELAQKTMKNFGLIASLITLTGLLLHSFGRSFWCPAGDLAIWSFDVMSQHNSQHLIDWYTPSHFSHGLLFAIALRALLPERLKPLGLIFAVTLEAGWELLENSDFIISRYRESTAAFNYFGDSIANSIADIFWCLSGYLLATRMRTSSVLLLFLSLEVLTLIFIRDNLSLNVLMLLYPIKAIKSWQLGL